MAATGEQMKRTIHVALMFPARISHLEKLTQGIADFARRHGGWIFVMRPDSLTVSLRSPRGCTPYEYLSRLRIERAKQLLTGQERLKISHVARARGFNYPLQRRRAFSRATGTTPQRFRQGP